jgi:hypothetical protein
MSLSHPTEPLTFGEGNDRIGHEDPFPRPGQNGRCGFGQETFAGFGAMGETRR